MAHFAIVPQVEDLDVVHVVSPSVPAIPLGINIDYIDSVTESVSSMTLMVRPKIIQCTIYGTKQEKSSYTTLFTTYLILTFKRPLFRCMTLKPRV